MIRVCCSSYHAGDRVFGEKEPIEDRSETHGYCPACCEKELAAYEGVTDGRSGTVDIGVHGGSGDDGVDRGWGGDTRTGA